MNNNSFLDKVKYIAAEAWIFLKTPLFLKNCGGILGMMIAILFLSSWFLKCYTNHGESLEVQDFVGMNMREVVKKAKSKSFSIVITDSIFVPDKEPNVVLVQNPVAYARVKENRTLYFTITKNTADLVLLPDIVGGNDDYNQYQKKLSQIGVKSKISERRFDEKLEENTILEVRYNSENITDKLQQGYKMPMGATLELVVSEKGGADITVPNLVCKKYDAAKFVINTFNLSVGTVTKDATVTNELEAYVTQQIPEYKAGSTIRVGEQIDIFLTQKRPANCPTEDEN